MRCQVCCEGHFDRSELTTDGRCRDCEAEAYQAAWIEDATAFIEMTPRERQRWFRGSLSRLYRGSKYETAARRIEQRICNNARGPGVEPDTGHLLSSVVTPPDPITGSRIPSQGSQLCNERGTAQAGDNTDKKDQRKPLAFARGTRTPAAEESFPAASKIEQHPHGAPSGALCNH